MHEAGHAVLMALLGHPLDHCTIKRFKKEDGITSKGHADGGVVNNQDIAGKGRDAVMPLLIVLMAGVQAEKHVAATDARKTGRSDFETANKFALMALCEAVVEGVNATITEEEVARKSDLIRETLEAASAEAERLVGENIAAITAVAERLLRRVTVPGDEVRAIVAGTRSAGPPHDPHE
jgi:ATP-dependent Zn protease